MKKLDFLKSMLIAAMLLVGSATFAQQKYAVLICGGSDNVSFEAAKQYDAGQRSEELRNAEFWNDTYLMWQELRSQGFTEENIIVLFRDGVDYPDNFPGINYPSHYIPSLAEHVTDDAATPANVVNTFAYLAQVITPNDFLFVWTFDHGGSSGGNSRLYLIDGYITDDDFAALTNPIAANKKVFWMGNNN